MTAVTSISTRAEAGVRAATCTRVLAGRDAPNVSSCARDLVDICHIENIDNGPYDVTQFRTGLTSAAATVAIAAVICV